MPTFRSCETTLSRENARQERYDQFHGEPPADRVTKGWIANKSSRENSLKVNAMANLEHVKLFKENCAQLPTWLNKNRSQLPALDLSSAYSFELGFPHAILRHWSGSGGGHGAAGAADQRRRNEISTQLFVDADFRNSWLRDYDFREFRLTGANFSGATLRSVHFKNTILDLADFDGALFDGVVISDCDLSTAKNLENAVHRGPSYLDSLTLMRSKSIPDGFLRGAGIPEDLITYLPSLRGESLPIEFYSCFISYSHHDEEFCRRLHPRMQQEKMRVWYAPEDMKAGQYLLDQIDQAIRVHDKLLLVLSEESMASDWVAMEISRAIHREETEGKRVLFPIRLLPFDTIEKWKRLDPRTGKSIASEITRYYIPDFSTWKNHDSFEREFARLLESLKSDAK